MSLLLLFLQAWINPPPARGQPLGSSTSTCLFSRCHLVSGWEISGPLESCPSISSFAFLGCEVPVLLTSLFFRYWYLLIAPHVRTTSVWPPVFCLLCMPLLLYYNINFVKCATQQFSGTLPCQVSPRLVSPSCLTCIDVPCLTLHYLDLSFLSYVLTFPCFNLLCFTFCLPPYDEYIRLKIYWLSLSLSQVSQVAQSLYQSVSIVSTVTTS